MRIKELLNEEVGYFQPTRIFQLKELLDAVMEEAEDVNDASIRFEKDPVRSKNLERDYRALTAIEYVIRNHIKALKNPELMQGSIFIYDWEEDPSEVGAIQIHVVGDVAEVKWLGSYGTIGRDLFKAGMERAKDLGAKRVKVTAKWNSEGFYRKMGLDQGETTSNPLAGSDNTEFTGVIKEVADKPYRYMLAKRTPAASQYIFMTDADTKYMVDATKETLSDGTVRLEIGFADVTKRDEPSIDITGKGDAFRIFATVAAIAREYIAQSKTPIGELIFKGKTKDPTRIKLYDRIAASLPRFLPDFKFKGAGSDGVDKVYFFDRKDVDQS
jgi:hypothetical protein